MSGVTQKPLRAVSSNRIIALLFSLFATLVSAAPQKIICSTDNPKDSLHVIALEEFGKRVAEYSNGQLLTEIHYRDSEQFPAIRGEEVNMNMVMSGFRDSESGLKVDVTVIAAGNASQKAPILDFLMLPYFFPEEDMAKRLFLSDFMINNINQTLAEKHNVRALGWLIGGYRNMTNSKRPVKRLEDINGLVIRTPRNRLMKDTYEAFGAVVKTINWSDTFDALKNGQVDGQENPYNVIYYSEFWKAKQRYVTNNSPFLWVGPILINQKFYAGLSPVLQAAVDRAAQEAQAFEWNWVAEQNSFFKAQLLENGMEISELEDKPRWIQAAKPIWEDYYANIGYGDAASGKQLVQHMAKLLTQK